MTHRGQRMTGGKQWMNHGRAVDDWRRVVADPRGVKNDVFSEKNGFYHEGHRETRRNIEFFDLTSRPSRSSW